MKLILTLLRSPTLNYSRNEQSEYIFSGYEGHFLQIVLDALNVKSKYLSIKEVYSLPNATDLVHKGEADIAYCYLPQQQHLLELVDFSMPYHVTAFTFAVKKSIPLETKFSFVYPFSIPVWVGCFAACMLLPLFYLFLVETRLTYLDLLSFFWVGIFSHPKQFRRQSLKNRILVATSLIFRLIISFSYAAVLLSFMANPLMNPPITNFRELARATKTSGTKVYLMDAIFIRNQFKNAEQTYLQTIYKVAEKHNTFYWYDNVDYANLYEAGDAIVLLQSTLLELEFRDKFLAFISKDALDLMIVSAYANKNFCCLKKLNTVLSRLWQTGLYNQIKKRETLVSGFSTGNTGSETSVVRPIRLENLFGVFMLLVVGYILSFIGLLFEITFPKVS